MRVDTGVYISWGTHRPLVITLPCSNNGLQMIGGRGGLFPTVIMIRGVTLRTSRLWNSFRSGLHEACRWLLPAAESAPASGCSRNLTTCRLLSCTATLSPA